MSTSVVVYRSDDVGAPTLTTNAGTLIAVLDACLVNGYGSKAAAGWTKPFSGTNKAAYRMGSVAGYPQHYLRVDDSSLSSSPWATLIGYETMTDVDTGTGLFPTNAQLAGGMFMRRSNSTTVATKSWVLIANNQRFVLIVRGAATSATLATTAAVSSDYYMEFGSFHSFQPSDLYNTHLRASVTNSSTAGVGANLTDYLTASVSGYTARSYTQVGTSIQVSRTMAKRSGQTLASNGAYKYPDPITGGMQLSRILTAEQFTAGSEYAERGVFPGLWSSLSSQTLGGWSTFDTLSGTGDLAGKDFIILPVTQGSSLGYLFVETNGTWGY